MIVFVVSALTAMLTAAICLTMVIHDMRQWGRISTRERQRKERVSQRLMVPVREHAEAKGIDIETLCILCGAEEWSEPGKQGGA